ncbi:MAG: sugar phosphate isomerase/epimerase family protein [Bacteroidota bacterium]
MQKLLIPLLFICLTMACLNPVVAQPEIGLQLYSLREQMPKDVAGTLDKIQAMGIKELEGGSTYGLTIPEFQKMIADRGMKMVAIGADFNDLEKDASKVLQNAKAWGVNYVVCYWIPHNGDDFTVADMNRAIGVLGNAGKLLSDNGVQLCYHPHGYEFRPHAQGTLFDYLATSVDKKHLQFEMDVFWIKHPGQDPVALLKKYNGRFELMHLKDRKPGTQGNAFGRADVETNVVLGTGDVGIAAIMKEAKAAGVKHFFIEDESSRSEQQIPQSLAFLKSLK